MKKTLNQIKLMASLIGCLTISNPSLKRICMLIFLAQGLALNPASASEAGIRAEEYKNFHYAEMKILNFVSRSERFQAACGAGALVNNDGFGREAVKGDQGDHHVVVIEKTISEEDKTKCQRAPDFNFLSVKIDPTKGTGELIVANGTKLYSTRVFRRSCYYSEMNCHDDGGGRELIGSTAIIVAPQPFGVALFCKETITCAHATEMVTLEFKCNKVSEVNGPGRGYPFGRATKKVIFSCASSEGRRSVQFGLELLLKQVAPGL